MIALHFRNAVIALACLTLGAGRSRAADALRAAPLPHDLERAAAAYDRAQVEGDRAALNRLLADDYLLVNGAGEVEPKAHFVTESTAAGFRLDPFTVERPARTVWRDGAVLAGEVRLTGLSDGRPFAGHIRFADVWARRAGGWRVVFTQVTRLPGAPPR